MRVMLIQLHASVIHGIMKKFVVDMENVLETICALVMPDGVEYNVVKDETFDFSVVEDSLMMKVCVMDMESVWERTSANVIKDIMESSVKVTCLL